MIATQEFLVSHSVERGADAVAVQRRSWWVAGSTLLVMVPVTVIVPGLKEMIADRYAAADFSTHAFMAVNLIGAMLAYPLIARWCDGAASRGRVGAAALVVDAILFAVMGVCPSVATLLAVRVVEGAAHMLALTALMALASDCATPERRGRAMGLVGCCMMLGTAAGTLLGGKLWRLWPGRSFEVAAGAALVAAIFVFLSLRGGSPRQAAPRRWGGSGLLRNHRALWIALSASFAERLCVGVIITSFVLLLGKAHDIDPAGRSMLLFAFLFPFAVCTYPAGRLVDRIGAIGPLIVGSAGFGMMMIAYGFVPAGWLGALMVASGLLSALMFAPTLSLCATLAPVEQRGSAFAGMNIAGSLGMICGPILGGVLSATIGPKWGAIAGYQAALMAAGGLEIVLAVTMLPWLLRLRRAGTLR